MKAAMRMRCGAFLVFAAASAAPLADEGRGASDAVGVEHRTVFVERYPDTDVEVNDRAEPSRAEPRRDRAGTGSAATDPGDESASFDERWLREREGYRDGGY